MPKILALDIGDVRVGTALCDQAGGVVLPHETFARAKGEAERKILELISLHKIKLVVVGKPLDEADAETEQSHKIENFCRRLQKRVEAQFHYVDEYGSSAEAEEKLSPAARKKLRSNKGMLDALSAAIILERYLDQLKQS